MERSDFIAIRDLPDKVISDDIVFTPNGGHANVVRAARINIENSLGLNLSLAITVNLETDEVNFNVSLSGTGPICRLDVRSNEHGPAGRHHKHDLVTEKCPGQNLKRSVQPRDELERLDLEELFRWFCDQARIEFRGDWHGPYPIDDSSDQS